MAGRAEYLCYTDGSCKSGEAAPGGWGFFIKTPDGATREGYGKATRTLAKVMEYRAVAEALAAVPDEINAVVFSDNQSLVENLEKKLGAWRDSSFVNVDPLLVEIVRRIDALIVDKKLSVRFQWIRAHNGNPGNERADTLAAQGAREAKADLGSEQTRRRR